MDSIYHIETDIECRVLHYGKEVCIATPGKDASIQLRKGRHKLAFISTENEADHYSIMYEVPENDIEDCIEVELRPFRDKRMAEEAEARRIAFEAEQKRLLEEKKKKDEERRKQEEEKIKREEEKRKEEHRRQITSVIPSLCDGKAYDDKYWGTFEADSLLIPKTFITEDNNGKLEGKVGFVDMWGKTLINPQYKADDGSFFPYGFSEGLSLIQEGHIPMARASFEQRELRSSIEDYSHSTLTRIRKVCYINSYGETTLSSNFVIARKFNPFFFQDRVIVNQYIQEGTCKQWISQPPTRAEVWEEFLRNPSPGVILDERTDTKEQQKELLVEFPRYRERYILIDKKGLVHCEILQKEGFNPPRVYPFSQGLSVIEWDSPEKGSIITAIDREGNIVLEYKGLPCLHSRLDSFDNSTVFLGEQAYLPVGDKKHLELSLDGKTKFLDYSDIPEIHKHYKSSMERKLGWSSKPLTGFYRSPLWNNLRVVNEGLKPHYPEDLLYI